MKDRRERKVGEKGVGVKGERKRLLKRRRREVDWIDCQIKKLKKRCLIMVVPASSPSLCLKRERCTAAEIDIAGLLSDCERVGGKIVVVVVMLKVG